MNLAGEKANSRKVSTRKFGFGSTANLDLAFWAGRVIHLTERFCRNFCNQR